MMRLRFGPHATRLAEQVVIRDPFYVVQTLAQAPDGVLADVFRDLIGAFDCKPWRRPCAACGRDADAVYAYPQSTALFGTCLRCVILSGRSPSAVRLDSYEDGVRHVASSFRRGARVNMRRIVGAMVLAKGGPVVLTESQALEFFGRRSARASNVKDGTTPDLAR